MSKFKAKVHGKENYISPEGIEFSCSETYNCNVVTITNGSDSPSVTDDLFMELHGEHPNKFKIGMISTEFFKHFVLFGRCEKCGAEFQTDYPTPMCPSCEAEFGEAFSSSIGDMIPDESFIPFKERFKE